MDTYLFAGLPKEIQMAVKNQSKNVNLRLIIEKEFDVPRGKLFTKTRVTNICNGRQLYASISYHTTKLSLKSVGGTIGGKDHATVLHARKNISRWLVQEKGFREKTIRVLLVYFTQKYHNIHGMGYVKTLVNDTIVMMIENKSRIQKRYPLREEPKEDPQIRGHRTDITNLRLPRVMAVAI